MKLENNIKNYDWIDSLRVLATFSVIFLHAASGILNQYKTVSNFDWWIGNIYDSAVRFCVPIFLMITGTVILTKTYESTREYLRKRVFRIVLPFLFWSVIYIAKSLFLKFHQGEFLDFITVLKFICFEMKNGAANHLWFIYMIIGLYLFFPIIGKWLRQTNKKEIEYFIGIWLLTIVCQLPFINKLTPNIDLSYFSGYIGFPILGYYLSTYTFDFKEKKAVYVLLIFTGILITIFGTFFITKHNDRFTDVFYEYLTPNVILVAVGVFLLFKDFVKLGTKMTNIVNFLNKYSYGIFLVHILVLNVLKSIGISSAFVNPIIGIPVTSLLCFIISTSIIFIINKLPFGKYISG